MKLLVVSQYFFPEQFRVNDVCFKLADMGHDVTVLTGLPNYPMGSVFDGYRWEELIVNPSITFDAKLHACLETIQKIKVIRCKLLPRKTGKVHLAINYLSFLIQGVRTAKAMARNPSDYKFDRILVFQYSPVTMALPAIWFRKNAISRIPLYLYCFDLWPESILSFGLPSNGPIYALFKALSKFIYKNIDYILVSSKNFSKYFELKHNIKNNISYLPIYAEDLFCNPLEIKQDSGMSTAPKNCFHFLFAGNIGEMQSLDTIIRAASLIKEAALENAEFSSLDPKLRICFHIVGDGSALERNMQLAKSFGLTNPENKNVSIRFYGRHALADMPDFYAMADAFIVTLKNDPFISYTLPGKVQSYMAFGKPILAAICGETADVINESNGGLVCPAEDDKAFARNILKFTSMQNEERLRLGVHAKEYYEQNFSSKAFFKALIDLLS